ncbi:MAG TPA: tyrosine-type recombinase/integrase [Ktedonobacteraceae bacterium]|nr:tyrosine-type recombinase/integrase [Ktedonobacteraceae bacterium]
MAKQRGHGEGSIYQRSDGRWAATITLEGRKRKTFYGKTRKEVATKLNEAIQEQKQGILATGPQQTMEQYLTRWLEEVHRPTIRESTYLNYRRFLDNHILPALGHIYLNKLTPQLVQSFYTQKLQEGLAPGSVRDMHMVLHKALENAVRWRLVGRNPCDDVSPPQSVQHIAQPLTQKQAIRLLEAAREHRLGALLTVALATGMRRGELLGLQWQDIDFEDRSLQIRRSMVRLGNRGVVESQPKTSKSRRKIPLPRFVIEMLKEHRTRQLEARLRAGSAWEENDLVFCNGFGRFFDQGQLHVEFQKFLKDAGLPPMRFHDLRHSAASFLLAMGVHPKVVQEILGHSVIGTTMDTYSHVLPSLQREAMDKMDDLFGRNV